MGKREDTTRVRPFRPSDAMDDASRPCLEILSGHATGRLVTLQPGHNLIGRTPAAQVSLDDDGVSRRHARIQVADDGMATLFDLDSTNGTFLNGARISRVGLREGDRIQIGSVAFRFGYRSSAVIEAAAKRGPAPPDPADPSPFTARELEIAQWVAEGLSNDEIAAELGISSRTVGTHLTNIYKRLEIHTRAELTRVVLERGLVGQRPPK